MANSKTKPASPLTVVVSMVRDQVMEEWRAIEAALRHQPVIERAIAAGESAKETALAVTRMSFDGTPLYAWSYEGKSAEEVASAVEGELNLSGEQWGAPEFEDADTEPWPLSLLRGVAIMAVPEGLMFTIWPDTTLWKAWLAANMLRSDTRPFYVTNVLHRWESSWESLPDYLLKMFPATDPPRE